jgi:hypothetical protein
MTYINFLRLTVNFLLLLFVKSTIGDLLTNLLVKKFIVLPGSIEQARGAPASTRSRCKGGILLVPSGGLRAAWCRKSNRRQVLRTRVDCTAQNAGKVVLLQVPAMQRATPRLAVERGAAGAAAAFSILGILYTN